MIAVQSPINALHRPSHGRHPSAPVVVRPTHTPGLLSLSKPAYPAPSRPQQPQSYPRAQRTSPPKRNNRPAVQQAQQQSAEKSAPKAQTTASPDRPPRGRQNKPAAVDKADKRSTSQSPRARRQAHQPSPPPPARIPQQTDAQARPPSKPLRVQSLNQTDATDYNPFDPFVVSSPTGQKPTQSTKPITFRALPELTRPSGKLARRRQSGQFTSPKTLPVSRIKEKSVPVNHSEPNLAMTPERRHVTRRVSTGTTVTTAWDFPICDDSDDLTPPSTPVRESASVPSKRTSATWQQQAFFDDAPRTAPPSAVFGYPFPDRASQNATPTPAQRRRNHRRVPSEGMFAMSTDDDSSSSDASEELKTLVGLIPKRRAQVVRRTPSPATPDSITAGFYAGSVFQNSPSPDELPVPAF
ncbi:hypothetical protein QCA50_015569 [Cerrena zonata]|uniref:Uncharacterized protein n=1 Tax=Cerrena zonata TaxID=2478898 RepID=A0AAW0FW09_9APHY